MLVVKMQQQESKQATTIIAFFDILGYEKLVQRMINEDDFVKYFDDLMYDITVNLLEGAILRTKTYCPSGFILQNMTTGKSALTG